jgi:aryl-alcohol dehydrogenase-like predicted oxidoreductase
MDVRSEFPRFSSEDIAANMPIVDFLRQFSEKKNATPAQISLACCTRNIALGRSFLRESPS